MFSVGIGHNAKRRIEPQLFFQRLAEIITLTAQLVILHFQCRQLRPLLLLHLDVLIKFAAQLATLPLQARQLLGKLGEELEPRFIELIPSGEPWRLLGDDWLTRMNESGWRV